MNSHCSDAGRAARGRWARKGLALLAVPMLALGCSDDGESSSSTTERERSTSTTEEPTTEETADTTSTTASTTTTSTTAPPTTAAPVPEQAVEFALGAKATYDDGSSVQVFSYEQPVTDDTSIIGPPSGSDFAAADVEVCTGSRAQTSLTAQGWAAYGPDGGTYQNRLSGPRFPALLLGPASPGRCLRGFIHFVVPTGERAAYLVWQEPGWESAKWRTS